MKCFYIISIVSLFYSCKSKNETQYKFLNNIIVKQNTYNKDSVQIIAKLKKDLENQIDFFGNSAYFEKTEIIIDSLIYNSNQDKIAAFIIIKNPTYRQLLPDKNHGWYYDATCYLGIRRKDSISLSWIGPSFTNAENISELKNISRKSYFTEYSTMKDIYGQYRYKYNIGDTRFWDCPIWKEQEDKEVRRKEFEKEKIIHPENIYEPVKKKA